jgi:transposase-like protein
MMTNKRSAEKTVRDIRRATRRHNSAEEKIHIVLEGLRGEDSIAELCQICAPVTANYCHLLAQKEMGSA